MQLPLLKSSFFANLDSNSLSNLLTASNDWSKEKMPVAIWDDKIIIALAKEDISCEEIQVPHIKVLAPAKQLEELYNSLFSEKVEPAAMPELSFENLNAQPVAEAPVVGNDQAEQESEKAQSTSSLNLDFSDLTVNENPTKNEESESQQQESLPASQEEEEPAQISKGDMPQASPEPQSQNAEKEQDEDVFVAQEKTATLHTDTNSLAHKMKDLIYNFEPYFDRVLQLDKQDNKLIYNTHLGEWPLDQNASLEVDLSNNSIFKIVNKTKHSYHGYMVANPINNAFLQAYNGGNLPEHITVVPVIEGNEIQSMIVGITSKFKAKKIKIQNLEEMALLEPEDSQLAA